MKAVYLVYFTLLLFLQIRCKAQIRGVIKEAGTNKPLRGALIFINNSTFSDVSDSNGEFEIIGVSPGFYNLVLYRSGYELFKSPIRIQRGILSSVNLSLKPSVETDVHEPVRKKTLNEAELKVFKNLLFGESKYSDQCRLLNSKILEFTFKDNRKLVSSPEPIVIQNDALGYRVTFFMSDFEWDSKSIPSGLIKMDKLSSTRSSQMSEWSTNQFEAYRGSLQHLFRTLVADSTTRHEFDVFDKDGRRIGTDSLAYLDRISGLYRININEKIRIAYLGGRSSLPQVSWIIPRGKVSANSDGVVLDLNSLIVIGKMNRTLSERLPDNFDIGTIDAYDQQVWDGLKQFQEKVYIQTDKAYYYPGEVVWMKAYMNYRKSSLRDSLSKVLHIDLVDSLNNLVETRSLKIDSGFAKGEFILPVTTAPGNYFLLGYTNYMRNFGTASLFKKSIPILNVNYKPDLSESSPENNASSSLSISVDKPSYATREKIKLTIQLNDVSKLLGANVSVSVTDSHEVVPIRETHSILTDLPFPRTGIRPTIESLRYPIEFGISFLGEYKETFGKKKPERLNVVQGNFENMIEAELDDNGMFWLDGLQFYDTAVLSFQINNRISKGGVKIIQRIRPDIEWSDLSDRIKLRKVDNPRNNIYGYGLSKEGKMLNEVIIKATKLEEPSEIRSYGRADHILKMDDLGPYANNLVTTLQGKIPGVSIYTTYDNFGLHYVIRMGRQQSILGNMNPLVMLDDVPMYGNAGDILQNIDASSIETIEVTTHLNSLYGEAGRAGVISLYTRKGPRKSEALKKTAQLIVLKGYDRPNLFESPQYDRETEDASFPDYRSTIYWNPDIEIGRQSGAATIFFFAADLHTTYNVVVEGVTSAGDPIRATLPIIVK